MRSLQILGLAAATASAGHLSVPVSRKAFGGANPHRTVKRQDKGGGSITLAALNNITGGGYYSEFEVGSPGQTISFQLDTGSSDTWMNSVESDLCQSKRLQSFYGYCQSTFDPDESETFDNVGEGDFDITYLDGRNIIGDYFEDTVTIGDANITGQRLGLALESVRVTGIMGLGFGSNVAAESQYPTIIDNLVAQGLIDSPAFSLYLNDLESDEGSVLFGGVDADKFVGELALLDLVPDVQAFNDDITSFNVRISGFDVVDPDGERIVDLHDLDSYAILDSGSTISLLPDRQVRALWEEFGVVSMENLIAPLIDCKYGGGGSDDYIFEFRFGSKTIQVPMHEMVVDAFYDIQDDIMADDELSEYFGDWEGVCMFGVGSTADFGFFTDKFTLLGDTFLRSAYVVYDLANEQVGIAQANLNSTRSSIVEIEKGDLPDVTGVSRQGDDSSSTATTSSTGGSPSSTGGPSSTGTTAAPGATETGGDGENSSDSNDDGDDDSLGSFVSVPGTLLMSLFGAALLAL